MPILPDDIELKCFVCGGHKLDPSIFMVLGGSSTLEDKANDAPGNAQQQVQADSQAHSLT